MKPIQVVSLVLLFLLSSCSKDQPLKPSQPPTLTDPSGKILALPWARIEPDPSTVAMVADSTWHTFQIHTDAESLRVKVNTDSADVILELATGHRAPISNYCPGEPNDEKKRKAAIRNGMVLYLQVCGEGTGEIVLEEYVYDHPLQQYRIQLKAAVPELEDDRAVLMALWEAMGRPTYSPRNWGSGVHLAKWFGVRVDSQGRVVEVDLSQGRRKATHLPAELGQLDQLRVLDLSAVVVEDPTAQLPPEWGNLVNLRVLKAPRIDHRSSLGPIPASWGNLVNLRHVDLRRYSVTHIPETLRAWTQVETLFVSAHHRDQDKVILPDIFDDWRALKYLNTGNLIIGEPFPPSLGQVSTLEFLYIISSSGQLPPGWGSGLTNIRSLRLFGQSGPLPAEWSNWSQVQEIFVGPFTGELPPEWGRLSTLEHLRLHGWPDQGKGLNGTLPPEWTGMTSLKSLIMVNQELTGPLPPEWGALTHLEKVELQGNLLTGPLPPEWGALTNLKELNLSYNLIDGPLPSEWGGMTAMEEMACEDCGLTGPLPAEWARWRRLKELNLGANALSGTIPNIWGGMSSLEKLYLRNNRFTGPFPQSLGRRAHTLRYLSLQGNALTGCAPSSLRDTRVSPSYERVYLAAASGVIFCDCVRSVQDCY